MLLIPNDNADTWGIGMLKVAWMVVEAVIDNCIKTVLQFHNVLHGFCVERVASTTIMELKLSHELVSVYQDPLFLVFLYLISAYDNLHHQILL